MKKLFLAILFYAAIDAVAQPNHIVISQVYGGGGNSGALFTHDFIELFNPTASSISLEGMSIQYSGAGTATWSSNKLLLKGVIAPGHYFLIQLNSGGPNGNALPAPDLAATEITLNASSGKLALIQGTETVSGSCPSVPIDLVGYGGADCFEAAVAPATANSTALVRKDNSCTDTDNNATDFMASIPDPRTSAAHPHTCNGQKISISSIQNLPFCIDAGNGVSGTLSFAATGNFNPTQFQVVLSDARGTFTNYQVMGTATVSGTSPQGTILFTIPAALPSGTAYRIRIQSDEPPLTGDPASIEIINGAKNADQLKAFPNDGQLFLSWINPSGCFDEVMIVVKEDAVINGIPAGDGSYYQADLNFKGNGTDFDGGRVVYKGIAAGQLVSGLMNGKAYHVKLFTRRGLFWSTGVVTSELPRVVPLPGEVVINQISPDYGGAQDEYIELVNITGKTFDLSDLTLRFTNADGRNVVAGGTLSGIMQPYCFWLISPNASITVGRTTALIPDQVIDGGFGAQNQQVGLVRKTDNAIIDALAYGTVNIPTYIETAASVNPPADGGLKRIIDGMDGNHNSQDFARVMQQDIELRNSKDLLASAQALIPAGTFRTLKVTGNAALTGPVHLTQKLIMENGIFSIGEHSLETAMVSGGNASSYVRTNGKGMLRINQVASTLFPVGNATYNPVTIVGEHQDWQARVLDLLPQTTPFLPAAAVQRSWEISPVSTEASGATLVFEYDDADPKQVGTSFNPAAVVDIWSFQANAWNLRAAAQIPVATAGRKSVTITGWKDPSWFYIAHVIHPLPVKFSGFRAVAQTASVDLEFVNETESDVLHYVLERSPNGKDFYPLYTLAPHANNGSKANYRVTDKHPFPGYNFYRVQGVELNGKSNYTYILKVNTIRSGRILSVFPNSITDRQLYWEATLPKGTFQLSIINPLGQEIVLQSIRHPGGNANHTLALPPGVQPGVYILQLRNNEKQLQTRFMVQ